MKRNKRGISLITLVITIIIMIILAGAIILTLTQSGIFDKANDAVSEYSLKQVQAIADLAWSEAYADGARDRATLQTAVNQALADNDLDDKYKAIATEKGVTVTEITVTNNDENITSEWVREYTKEGVPIPIGFVASPYDGEKTINEGLVIYALTADEIINNVTDITTIDVNQQESLEKRNQFVWVPVPQNEFKTKFVRDFENRKGKGGIINTIQSNGDGDDTYPVWELVLDENNMPSQDIENDNIPNFISPETLTEATKMYASVAKYGGFYIGRYEVGNTSVQYYDKCDSWAVNSYIASRVSISEGTNKNLSITMGKYPYNYLRWEPIDNDYIKDDGALALARAFYPAEDKTYGVVSTLTYGVQWDTTLNWWKELDPTIDFNSLYYVQDIETAELAKNVKYSYISSGMDKAVFSEWVSLDDEKPNVEFCDAILITTGGCEKTNIYNIYDMKGNVWERTMEGYRTNRHSLRDGMSWTNYSDRELRRMWF